MTDLTQTQLSRRPFWLPGQIGYFSFGDWIIRYGANNGYMTKASGQALDTTKTVQRLGGTSFLNVMNRQPWYELRNGLHVLGFGSLVQEGSGGGDGTYNMGQMFTAALGCRFDDANNLYGYPFFVGDNSKTPYFLAAPATLEDTLRWGFQAMKEAWENRPLAGDLVPVTSTLYHGQPMITVSSGSTAVTSDGNGYGLRMNWGTAAQLHNLWYPYSGGTWGGLRYGLGRNPGPDIGHYTNVSAEDPAATAFRTAKSWTGGLSDGIYYLPSVGIGTVMECSPLHGLHKAIKAIVLDDDMQVKYVVASFTRAEIITTLISQRDSISDAPLKAQMDAVVTAVQNQVDSTSLFRLLVSASYIGPKDIYESDLIVATHAAGATWSDIDSNVVSGKSMATWRSTLLAAKPVKALLWMDQPGGATYRQVFLTTTTSAPYFQVNGPAVIPGAKVQLSTGSINDIIAVGHYATRDQVVLAVETALGVTVMDDDVPSILEAQEYGVMYPWEDLEGLWFKRGVIADWQPLANALTASIMEPAAPFQLP